MTYSARANAQGFNTATVLAVFRREEEKDFKNTTDTRMGYRPILVAGIRNRVATALGITPNADFHHVFDEAVESFYRQWQKSL